MGYYRDKIDDSNALHVPWIVIYSKGQSSGMVDGTSQVTMVLEALC